VSYVGSPVRISSPVAKAFLGRSVTFKGQILSRENLTIDGEVFVGDIHCGGVVIEDGAYINAGIELSRQPVDDQHSAARGAKSRDSSFDLAKSGQLGSLADEVRLPGTMQ
jgi:hypothetical protein